MKEARVSTEVISATMQIKDVEEVVALSALFKGCLVDVPLGGEAR